MKNIFHLSLIIFFGLFIYFFIQRLEFQSLYFFFFVIFINILFFYTYKYHVKKFYMYVIFSSFFLFSLVNILFSTFFENDTSKKVIFSPEQEKLYNEQLKINDHYGRAYVRSDYYGDGVRSLRLPANYSSNSLNTNSLGFRGKEFQKKEKKRILVFGGSSAFGWQASDGSKSFCGFLEDRFSENGEEFDVVNLAVPTGNSAMDINIIGNYVLDLEPDLVVFLTGHNDLNGSVYNHRKYGDFTTKWLHSRTSFQYNVEQFKDSTSNLILKFFQKFILVDHLIKHVNKQKNENFGEINELKKDQYYEFLDTYVKNMNKIYTLLNQFGSEVIVFHQPISAIQLNRFSENRKLTDYDSMMLKELKDNRSFWESNVLDHERKIEKITNYATAHGVEYIDFNYVFENWEKNVRGIHVEDTNSLYVSFAHWTSIGNKLLSEEAYKIIKRKFSHLFSG